MKYLLALLAIVKAFFGFEADQKSKEDIRTGEEVQNNANQQESDKIRDAEDQAAADAPKTPQDLIDKLRQGGV